MSEKGIGQHKRLAMGDKVEKRAIGGMVTPRVPKTGQLGGMLPSPVASPGAAVPSPRMKVPGMPMNPVTQAKMQNGVPGMKKGGKSKAKAEHKKKGGKC